MSLRKQVKDLEATLQKGAVAMYWYQKTLRRWEGKGPARTNRDVPLYYSGRTICVVRLPNGDRYIGVSECGKCDQFDKVMGRLIALGRALTGRREIHNPPNFLFRLGAPWQLWYDEQPEFWPDRELVIGENPVRMTATMTMGVPPSPGVGQVVPPCHAGG